MKTFIYTLSSTPTLLTLQTEVPGKTTISVQNLDGSASVYLGTDAVTSTDFGVKLSAGDVWSADLRPYDKLYAVGAGDISVLILER